MGEMNRSQKWSVTSRQWNPSSTSGDWQACDLGKLEALPNAKHLTVRLSPCFSRWQRRNPWIFGSDPAVPWTGRSFVDSCLGLEAISEKRCLWLGNLPKGVTSADHHLAWISFAQWLITMAAARFYR